MNIWETFHTEFIVFVLSILPISEIRGALIYGIPAVGKNFSAQFTTYVIAAIGNFLPIPFVVLLFRPILKLLRKIPCFGRLAEWAENRTRKKAGKLAKIGTGALFVFVAIPLPTTGAWTGAMIASLLDIRLKYALPAILAGILVAGLIVLLLMNGVLSFGVLDSLFLK